MELKPDHTSVKLHVSTAQKQWLCKESKETGLKMAEIMRRAIDYYRTAPASVRSLHKEE
jgi:hypothetical protein